MTTESAAVSHGFAGARLEKLRRELGLTSKEMASLLNITKQRWYNYETDRRPLDIDVAVILKTVSGCGLDFIYLGDDKDRNRTMWLAVKRYAARVIKARAWGPPEPTRLNGGEPAKPKRKPSSRQPKAKPIPRVVRD